MIADKRSVHTDALQTLGTIITEGGRDAIHLAVEPVIAGEQLRPGEHIGIIDGKAYSVVEKHLGIVDPFLGKSVLPGEKFWLIVYPRQITSLRHVWEHPDFPEEGVTHEKLEIARLVANRLNGHSQWIKDFALELKLKPNESVVYGDGKTFHFRLTRIT